MNGKCNEFAVPAPIDRAAEAPRILGVETEAEAAWNSLFPLFATPGARASFPDATNQFRGFVAGYLARAAEPPNSREARQHIENLRQEGSWEALTSLAKELGDANARVAELETWIPVGKQMPELRTTVLVACGPIGDVQVAQLIELEPEPYFETLGDDEPYPATHWMPLPAPPVTGAEPVTGGEG